MSEPLRVLHVAQPTTEGVAVVTAAWVRDQVARGWQVTVACPAAGDLASDARAAGARHLPWAATREPGPAILRETRSLQRIVREVRPDVVHLQSSKAGLAGRLAVRGRIPTVFSPHAWSFRAGTGVVAHAALRWERFATRWTSVLLCVSDAEQVEAESLGVRGEFAVARNGVDLDELRYQDAAARRAARARLGLEEGPLAVCVGRVCRQKGQDVLAAAWPEVTAAVPGARAVLVGDGPDLDALSNALPPRMRAVGRSSDVPSWLAAADVVVLPSRWEGLSLALLEAMACGRMVVASEVAGAAEALGQHGVLVPVEDGAALATALGKALRDTAASDASGRALRLRAEAMFDQRQSSATVAETYLRLLG